MSALASVLRELRGPHRDGDGKVVGYKFSQEGMAEIAGVHMRTYTRLEQGFSCRFSTIQSIIDTLCPSPLARAAVILAWLEAEIGEENLRLVKNQLQCGHAPKSSPHGQRRMPRASKTTLSANGAHGSG